MIQKTRNKIDAVIFDMDGVIINSEKIWERAEKEVFSSVGVKLSEKLCRYTKTMTTSEVTHFWFDKYPWKNKSLKEVENGVIERVAHLIKEEGKAIDGVENFIKYLKSEGYKIGLATNSPSVLIPIVLKKLSIGNYFDAISSAEHEPEGKPNPFVYLTTIKKLNVEAENCVAIEDSGSGLLAAKRAHMKTVLICKDFSNNNENADYRINSYHQFDFSVFN